MDCEVDWSPALYISSIGITSIGKQLSHDFRFIADNSLMKRGPA
jgi:hypothetical protein